MVGNTQDSAANKIKTAWTDKMREDDQKFYRYAGCKIIWFDENAFHQKAIDREGNFQLTYLT